MNVLDRYVALMHDQGNRLYTIRIMDQRGNCKRKLCKFLRPCEVAKRAHELCIAYGGYSFEFIEEDEEGGI